MNKKEILILGIGNILLKDDGVGVHAVHYLENAWSFSDNVRIVDGGTLGSKLLGIIEGADHLIVVDTFMNDREPGTIYRVDFSGYKGNVVLKNSLHQVNFLETLAYGDLLGLVPEKVEIVGIEPGDITPYGTGLTAEVHRNFEKFCSRVIETARQAGAEVSPKAEAVYEPEKLLTGKEA